MNDRVLRYIRSPLVGIVLLAVAACGEAGTGPRSPFAPNHDDSAYPPTQPGPKPKPTPTPTPAPKPVPCDPPDCYVV